MALWSNGHDTTLSQWKQEFNSPQSRQKFNQFSVRMTSSDKLRKMLSKIYDYQVKIDQNLQKFDKLLEKHFSNLIDKSNAPIIFLTNVSD